MRVLIALDATPECGDIVKSVALRPWADETKFLLLHVLDPFPFAKAPLTLERALKAAETQLQNVCSPLCSRGWDVDREVVVGRPRQAIARIAAAWKSDLIVIGANQTTALTRLLLGSTASAVLRHAQCSVEIVRPALPPGASNTDGMRILVATDGSHCSTAALRAVAGARWPADSVAKVISFPEPFLPLGAFSYMDLKEIERQNQTALADAKRYVAAGAQLLEKAGLRTVSGTPEPCDSDAREIIKEAEHWKTDLIVVGSHGRHGFDRMTMGSVSEHVALHAPCSVEVIRETASEQKEREE